ncbi:MAG: hypothetical protein BECKG1743D_GA0114223_103231 [Candidatus Kentron sp. G]|nr:MAG: hypothetical protein BECKG1743D_GA0114223_103231 [Candidatus Kentron sp. G]VFN02896.1 MAG: hypothetical protein BECKG1743F_GA0114225_107341 [Candidatus Kentron sp. G]VFN04508.1 MAG: hypothetical protein BECKG1743E_GA0114224_107391 [Candidatus Kentron sp. G]
MNEWPDIAWNLIIELLPSQHQSSSGSHKPNWRKTIPEDWEKEVTRQEYRQQASFYAGLAVDAAGYDTARLSELIDHFDNLPPPAFDRLVEVLASPTISDLPEEQRLPVWDHLRKFTHRHRRHADAKWALPDEPITRIEKVAKRLAPTNPFNRYRHLFTDDDFDLYENDNWNEQEKKFDKKRETVITEIFRQDGVEGVVRFAGSVVSPGLVGQVLGTMADEVVEQTLLPNFLDTADNKQKALVSGFIWRRRHINGWEWCDGIDRSDWTPGQIGHFLACLPFTKGAWDRASQWLEENQVEYWSRAGANPYQAGDDLAIAVDKLIEYGRPYSAIHCLDRMRRTKQSIDIEQSVRALLAALSSSEPTYDTDISRIVGLIKFLQSEPSVDQDGLFQVEWAYLPWLDGYHGGAAPKLLESRLASDPEFFCEAIRLIYRSKNKEQPSKEPTEEAKAIAKNAWRLLREWKTPPGAQENGTFRAERFNQWLQRVKTLCAESGHLEIAFTNIGEVLIHAPADPDGLWIHRAAATALNDRDAEEMRAGFSTGTYNPRGVHLVPVLDPTGKPERELAERFRSKAEAVENAGYQRFAITLRDLADDYEHKAERVINRAASY